LGTQGFDDGIHALRILHLIKERHVRRAGQETSIIAGYPQPGKFLFRLLEDFLQPQFEKDLQGMGDFYLSLVSIVKDPIHCRSEIRVFFKFDLGCLEPREAGWAGGDQPLVTVLLSMGEVQERKG
jgi:hypothetical protein